MIVLRPLIRLLIRLKGRLWVAMAALRIYRHLPGFAQRRVRRRAVRAWPQLLNRWLSRGGSGRR